MKAILQLRMDHCHLKKVQINIFLTGMEREQVPKWSLIKLVHISVLYHPPASYMKRVHTLPISLYMCSCHTCSCESTDPP